MIIYKGNLLTPEKFYPLASSTWDEDEKAAMQKVIDSNNFTMGSEVQAFENRFAEYHNVRHAIMVNSGSSANLLLLNATMFLNSGALAKGDSIIVPTVSWSTTYFPIHQLGMRLIFVDVDPGTLNIDVDLIEKAITPTTKAIFAVNLLGNPADWIRLREIALKHDLILLEDNCESMGASIGNELTGTFGIGGTFSTFFSHHISTMEGGLVTTNDTNLYEIMLSLRAHGWTRNLPADNSVFPKTGNDWDDLFRFVLPGYNFRPLEMEGSIGTSQLRKLNQFVETRRNNASHFINLLSNRQCFRTQASNGNSSWFGFSLVLTGKLKGLRRELVSTLEKVGIETRPIVTGDFTQNPVMKYLNHQELGNYPVAADIHENGLFLGNHHYDLTYQLEKTSQLLSEFEEKYG